MSANVEKLRYFEIAHSNPAVGNFLIKEAVTWSPTSDTDPRGVALIGESGKFIWTAANNPVQLLPPNTDPSYWNYYALPLNPAFDVIRQLTADEWDVAMAARVAELAAAKGDA